MTTQPLCVLSIDDDPTEALLLDRMLKRSEDWDVQLVSALTAADGLEALAQHSVDIVLLDYQLGAENGLTLLGAIRQAGYECPVVFLTGQGDEELVLEALRAGAADYLPKASLSPNSIRRTVKNVVERCRLEVLVRDHQERLRATNSSLESRNAEINQFYHTLSHELKTPLTSAIEFISIVLDGIAGEVTELQDEYLNIARSALREMAINIEDLVDASRLETGKLRLDRSPGDLAQLVTRTARSMGPRADEAQISVDVVAEDDLPPASMDASRLNQVIRNLFTNALKFTPSGGRISVRVGHSTVDDDLLEVSVADTGRGIPEADLARVFERLHQVKEDDCGTAGGLGLGLNICRELVALHGGSITVDSIVDQGATFTFTVPIHSDSAAPTEPAAAIQP